MSLARTVQHVVVDVEQLINLYRQLLDVPAEVQNLYKCILSTYATLKDTESYISKDVLMIDDDASARFQAYRDNLLDVELFLDPEQILPRSGPGSDAQGVKPWNHEQDLSSCNIYWSYLEEISTECQRILTQSSVHVPSPPYETTAPLDYPALTNSTLSDDQLEPIFQVQRNLLSSPFLSPFTSPNMMPTSHPPMPITYLSLSDSVPTPVSPFLEPELTLANLPSANSSKRKRKDKTLAEKRVQQLIQEQFGSSMAAGKKRKRREDIKSVPDKTPTFAPVPNHLIPLHPPPQYPPPGSPKLSPREVLDDNPDWSLDDIRDALPDAPKSSKGKERAPQAPVRPGEATDHWDANSSVHTGSSSNSIHSSAREGSIFSTASTDRMYEDGACKIWYRSDSGLSQLNIMHIEVKRMAVSSGSCISVYSRTPDTKVVRDDLWMSSMRQNATPFFENIEIVNTMKRYHDVGIECVVKFAPNPERHPQYSFASMRDGWEFVQYVVGKQLVCSINVNSIKSACTHGNQVESGIETIQIWEEEAEPGKMRTRTVKFFRNKNPSVGEQVVEFNCNALRPPERDGKTGKVTFRFRDMRVGSVKDMKYLKIAFANEEERDNFIHDVGFTGH